MICVDYGDLNKIMSEATYGLSEDILSSYFYGGQTDLLCLYSVFISLPAKDLVYGLLSTLP